MMLTTNQQIHKTLWQLPRGMLRTTHLTSDGRQGRQIGRLRTRKYRRTQNFLCRACFLLYLSLKFVCVFFYVDFYFGVDFHVLILHFVSNRRTRFGFVSCCAQSGGTLSAMLLVRLVCNVQIFLCWTWYGRMPIMQYDCPNCTSIHTRTLKKR